LKEKVAEGPLDAQSGKTSKDKDSHDAVGQKQPSSETELTN